MSFTLVLAPAISVELISLFSIAAISFGLILIFTAAFVEDIYNRILVRFYALCDVSGTSIPTQPHVLSLSGCVVDHSLWDALPNGVFAEIWSYFSYQEVNQILGPVSKAWYNIACLPNVHSDVGFVEMHWSAYLRHNWIWKMLYVRDFPYEESMLVFRSLDTVFASSTKTGTDLVSFRDAYICELHKSVACGICKRMITYRERIIKGENMLIKRSPCACAFDSPIHRICHTRRREKVPHALIAYVLRFLCLTCLLVGTDFLLL